MRPARRRPARRAPPCGCGRRARPTPPSPPSALWCAPRRYRTASSRRPRRESPTSASPGEGRRTPGVPADRSTATPFRPHAAAGIVDGSCCWSAACAPALSWRAWPSRCC
ncbi:MAG: hypothetical protein CMH34_04285 [Microbacterium sp.]|nr:hypothetical protein [Microbacterium sp.]